jgi:putative phosphonate metabolism protein
MSRYALYYAPRPDEELAVFAARWLGRDPETGREMEPPRHSGLPPIRLAALIADPRRYGFHGTLKPPFALPVGATEDALLALAANFSRQQAPFAISGLKLALLGDFIALVPQEPTPVLDEFAAECVRAFDPFRALPDARELARRREAGLTERQDRMLVRWGYPYVLDEFRFHLTLTGRLSAADREVIWPILARLTEKLCGVPVPLRDLVVFGQPSNDEPFRVVSRFRRVGLRRPPQDVEKTSAGYLQRTRIVDLDQGWIVDDVLRSAIQPLADRGCIIAAARDEALSQRLRRCCDQDRNKIGRPWL